MSVVDIHALHDRAKRFVVGAVLKRMFEEKESLGTSRPLVFVVLDENVAVLVLAFQTLGHLAREVQLLVQPHRHRREV